MNFYNALNINNFMTAIHSRTNEILYLIQGSREALLVDTGLGVGHLKDFVGTLTWKPLTVVLTNGHWNHAMGAPEFEKVYLGSGDRELYKAQSPVEVRKEFLRDALGREAEAFTEADFVPSNPEYPFLNLEDGMVFDLGDFHVEAYRLPGHTAGSFVFLIREYRILIAGDSCCSNIDLTEPWSLSVGQFQENLKCLQEKLEGRYHRLFLCHGTLDGGENGIKEAIELCEEIKAGKADEIPYPGSEGLFCLAKRRNEYAERADGKFANIIYDKNRVF